MPSEKSYNEAMKCLTENQCSEWLQRHKILEKPWHRSIKDNCYYFPLTSFKNARAFQALAQEMVELLGEYETVLFHIGNCSPWRAGQFELIEAVRRSHGETRELLEAPGHLYELKNKDELIGMFWLTMAYGWSSYLYPLPCTNIIFNFEGVFIDIWNFDSSTLTDVKETAEYYTKRTN